MTTYPRVHLTEEVLREGMQIESADISVNDKLRLLDALSDTGLTHVVVGSFVSPKYTPQMRDIDQLVERFEPRDGVRYSSLILNAKGQERADAHGDKLSDPGIGPYTYAHVCDTFTRRNVNQSQADEIAAWPMQVKEAVASGVETAGIGANAVFGSNFEGEFSLDETYALLEQQHALWSDEGVHIDTVWLGDPMSFCAPHRVAELVREVRRRWPAITHYYLHLHDARGLALASTYAAVEALSGDGTGELDVHFDTTLGGIGGCPYCGNGRATGMAATEDVVNMLDGMGIETGVDLPKLIEAVWLLEEILGRPTPGHVAKAGPTPRASGHYDSDLPFVETHEQALHFAKGPDVLDGAVKPWKAPIPSPFEPGGNRA